MMKTFAASLCLLFFSAKTHAALRPVAEAVSKKHELNVTFPTYNVFINPRDISNENIRQAVSSGTSLDILPAKLTDLVNHAPGVLTFNIPYKGKTISVELVSVDMFTEDFSVLTSGDHTISYTPGVYYRGIIRGNPNSVAAFSFFKDELYGIVSDDANGNLVIGRVIRQDNKLEYIVYSDRDLLKPMENYCMTADKPLESKDPNIVARQTSSSTVKCARFYYEIDNNIYQINNNNVINTTNWITAVHNNVSTLYANDNISVSLSQVFIWTTTDPYIGLDESEQLALFHSTRTSFNGDVGQLVGKDEGFNGLADGINGLCSSMKYSYTDVFFDFESVPTYSWTIETVTHELGHLLGSRHTHNCSWPGGAIDDCGPDAGFPTEGGCPPGPTPVNGGTIMSFCHLVPVGINFNNGFGPLPAAAIVAAVNNAVCLGTICSVCPVPAHNSCSTPAVLTATDSCAYTAGALCAASESLPAISCNGRTAVHAYDVWYSIVPSQPDLTINCKSGTNTDIVLALYSGTCGAPVLITCSDATTTGGLETISTTVTAGSTYLIRVYDFNGNTVGRDFGICASHSCISATNDNCATPIVLNVGLSCSNTLGELCSATQTLPPVDCSGFISTDSYDLFYSITVPQTNVKITCQSGAATDAVLSLYSGTCGNLTLVQCNDTTTSGGVEILNNDTLIPGTTYFVRVYDWNGMTAGASFHICAQYTPCTPPTAPASANATVSTICNGSSTTLNVVGTLTPGAVWKWYTSSCGGTPVDTGASITVSPTLTTTYYVRAEQNFCYSACTATTVTVIQIPSNPVSSSANPVAVCSGGSSTLSVTGTLSPGASWQWYSGSCGATPVGSGASISVSPGALTNYYVRAENGSCLSNCVNTSVDVVNNPNDPVSASGTSPICSGTNTTLQVNGTLSPGAAWKWYSGSCGGTPAGTGASVSVSPVSTTTYYVRAENGGCFSNCVNTSINVVAGPSAPVSISGGATVCQGVNTNLQVNGTLSPGATWQWYSGTCGGTPVGSGTSINVAPATTTTYFVRAENGTCNSTCVSATVTIVSAPAAPVSATGTSPVCAGANSTLQVTGTLSPGASWHWYSGSCGGTAVGTGASVSVTTSTNTTYYVRAETGTCFSNCVSTNVAVTTGPAAPTSASASSPICAGTGSTLQVNGTLSPGATWQWYTGSCGMFPAGTGATLLVSPATTTTYYVRAENGTCNSACVTTSVTVTPVPNNPTSATGSTPVCTGGTSALHVNGTLSSGATWHWYSTSCGGTPVGTGANLSVTPASNTTYYVRAENGNCFSNCVNTAVDVIAPPSDPVSATGTSPICSGTSSTLNVNGTLSPGATWHWYSASCNGSAAGTGNSVSVSPATTTTYYVRAEIGSCFSACVNTVVNVNATPADPASLVAPSVICAGSSASLEVNGTLPPGATWNWYTVSCGGTPVATGDSISVSPASATAYYVRGENGSCHSACLNTTVDVTTPPANPDSIQGNTDICLGASSVLQVSGTLSPGATWNWYSTSCGGTSVGSGTSVTITPLTSDNYFVRAEIGHCYSGCVSTAVDVVPLATNPSPINATSAVICEGDSVTLTETGIPTAGSDWYWYSDSCGGNLIGQGSSVIVSPATTQTFYVRAQDANCYSTCVNLTIDVNPPPAQPSVIVHLDTLSVPAFPAYQWYWSVDLIFFNALGTTQEIKAVNDGYYFVVVTDANGCTASSDTVHIVDPLSVNNAELENLLSVYPNPVSESVNIQFKRSLSEKVNLKIFDSTGRLVYSTQLQNEKTNVISLASYAGGVYQLLFTMDKKVLLKKVVKQ